MKINVNSCCIFIGKIVLCSCYSMLSIHLYLRHVITDNETYECFVFIKIFIVIVLGYGDEEHDLHCF